MNFENKSVYQILDDKHVEIKHAEGNKETKISLSKDANKEGTRTNCYF